MLFNMELEPMKSKWTLDPKEQILEFNLIIMVNPKRTISRDILRIPPKYITIFTRYMYYMSYCQLKLNFMLTKKLKYKLNM